MKENTFNLKEVLSNFDTNKGGYLHFFGQKSILEDAGVSDSIATILNKYIGSSVVIDCRKNPFIEEQNSFENSIRICGVLEHNSKQYRVLVNDNTYCYFQIINIVELGIYGEQEKLINKSKAKVVIGVRF